MRCAPRAPNGPNHLGLCALQISRPELLPVVQIGDLWNPDVGKTAADLVAEAEAAAATVAAAAAANATANSTTVADEAAGAAEVAGAAEATVEIFGIRPPNANVDWRVWSDAGWGWGSYDDHHQRTSTLSLEWLLYASQIGTRS